MKQCPSCNQGTMELVESTTTHNLFECTNCRFLEPVLNIPLAEYLMMIETYPGEVPPVNLE